MESGSFAFNGIAIRTYSLVEWNGVLLSIGLRFQFIVAWRAFLPMKTPCTNLVTVFEFGLALTWSEVSGQRQMNTEIYTANGDFIEHTAKWLQCFIL